MANMSSQRSQSRERIIDFRNFTLYLIYSRRNLQKIHLRSEFTYGFYYNAILLLFDNLSCCQQLRFGALPSYSSASSQAESALSHFFLTALFKRRLSISLPRSSSLQQQPQF